MICGNIGINKNGNLTFAGQDTVEPVSYTHLEHKYKL